MAPDPVIGDPRIIDTLADFPNAVPPTTLGPGRAFAASDATLHAIAAILALVMRCCFTCGVMERHSREPVRHKPFIGARP